MGFCTVFSIFVQFYYQSGIYFLLFLLINYSSTLEGIINYTYSYEINTITFGQQAQLKNS